MMVAITGRMIGPELLKALNLEGQSVRAIDIRVRTNEAVTITTESLMIDEQAKAVTTVLGEYLLIPRPSIINDFSKWFVAACARAGV